jgi:oligogalacturonide lyase
MRIALLLLALALCTNAVAGFASDVGKGVPPEDRVLVDRLTGVPIHALTTSPANDANIYQTHPQRTTDGQYIVCSDRVRALVGRSQSGPGDPCSAMAAGSPMRLADGQGD